MLFKDIVKYLWHCLTKRRQLPNSHWELPLSSDTFWPKECWGYVSENVTWMFESQIGRIVKAYIDDMVVKSKQVSEPLKDL